MQVRGGPPAAGAGIVRRQSAALFELPTRTNFSLTLSPNPRSASPDATPESYPLEVDPTFGTFTLRLPIPKGARFTTYSLELHPSIGRVALSEVQSFIVADPRPPTVALQLTAAPWVSACHLQRRASACSHRNHMTSSTVRSACWR